MNEKRLAEIELQTQDCERPTQPIPVEAGDIRDLAAALREVVKLLEKSGAAATELHTADATYGCGFYNDARWLDAYGQVGVIGNEANTFLARWRAP